MTQRTEPDLREALRADAGAAPMSTETGWAEVATRRAHRRRNRRLLLASAAAFVVAVAASATVAVVTRDDESVELTPPPVTTPSTTSALPPSTVTAGLPQPGTGGCSAASWRPLANSPEEIDSFAALGTPEATAAYIQAKANTCDYAALRTVMADDFRWSATEPPGADAAITAWHALEAHGDPAMYDLVHIVRSARSDYDAASGITSWKDPSDQTGYRVEIDDRGIWIGFFPEP